MQEKSTNIHQSTPFEGKGGRKMELTFSTVWPEQIQCTRDKQCTNVRASGGWWQQCNLAFPSQPWNWWYYPQHFTCHNLCTSISGPGDNLSHLGEVKSQGADGLKLQASQVHKNKLTGMPWDAAYANDLWMFWISRSPKQESESLKNENSASDWLTSETDRLRSGDRQLESMLLLQS